MKKLIKLFNEQTDKQQANDKEKTNDNKNDNKGIEKEYIDQYNELKTKIHEFIKWREDNKINQQDDYTKEGRLKAINLANSLRKNFDDKKVEEFINLAKESISMMKEYKATFQFGFEDLKQL